MNDPGQAGSARISAANALISWAFPDMAGKAAPPPASTGDQNLNLSLYLSQLKDDELDTILDNLEAAAASSAAGEAAAEG
jgi:hypothetical protein